MTKYRVEVGSFCTRYIQRCITVNASNEDEAASKAIDEFKDLEWKIATSIDYGSPRINNIEEKEG